MQGRDWWLWRATEFNLDTSASNRLYFTHTVLLLGTSKGLVKIFGNMLQHTLVKRCESNLCIYLWIVEGEGPSLQLCRRVCCAQLSLGGSWFQPGMLNIVVKTLKANTTDLSLFCVPKPNDILCMSKNSNQLVATDEMLNAHWHFLPNDPIHSDIWCQFDVSAGSGSGLFGAGVFGVS